MRQLSNFAHALDALIEREGVTGYMELHAKYASRFRSATGCSESISSVAAEMTITESVQDVRNAQDLALMAAEVDAALSVHCPSCKVAPEIWCRFTSGLRKGQDRETFHDRRITAGQGKALRGLTGDQA